MSHSSLYLSPITPGPRLKTSLTSTCLQTQVLDPALLPGQVISKPHVLAGVPDKACEVSDSDPGLLHPPPTAGPGSEAHGASLSSPSLTDSTSLGPKPLPSPPATTATYPAEVAGTPEPPEHPDRVSSGAQQGGVCGSGCRLFSNCLCSFQSPVPGCRKSKGMKCT